MGHGLRLRVFQRLDDVARTKRCKGAVWSASRYVLSIRGHRIFAAKRLAPIVEPRLVTLFADDPEAVVQSLGLRPAETGGNVLIARPFDPVVFERAEYDEGIIYARVTQVLLDLTKGPGRRPAEAEALLEWMRGQ